MGKNLIALCGLENNLPKHSGNSEHKKYRLYCYDSRKTECPYYFKFNDKSYCKYKPQTI